MTKIFSYTQAFNSDIVDAFCVLQKGFTDQFVYYDKERKTRYMGMGRCVALGSLHEVESELQGTVDQEPIFFSFNRFDAENPKPVDELFQAFPRLKLLLPEIVLIENEAGSFLQVNSLGPVYAGRVERFARQGAEAPPRVRVGIPYELEPDSLEQWTSEMEAGLQAIDSGRVDKVVLSRRKKLVAKHPFSSKDLVVNLIDGPSRGTVLLYRYGDVFFCGCTPELLVKKQGRTVESMCLAGTTGVGNSESERERLANELLHDDKNLREHAYVVDFIREVFRRNCHDVEIPEAPGILSLKHVQHLFTPVRAQVRDGVSLNSLMKQLHPTPALSGAPVGEAMMLIRQIESYNRGLYGGACGYVDAAGNGEYSVGLRTGVFDGEIGWVYAGCGVVSDSVAADEFDEIDLKLKTILSAFCGGHHE
ncbi:MAG: isochorismate synthase [Raoultibacter sp.]|jgi:isochorismate synthase